MKRVYSAMAALILIAAAMVGAVTAPQGKLRDAVPVCLSAGEAQEGNMSGLEFAAGMKIGWNLGNTFDAPGGETYWGNPVTTNELLVMVKELGFETIRIPISWGKHVSAAPEYRIDEEFLARVDTVVNQALDAGLYVIINSHHDNEIYMPTPENAERGKQYLSAIWAQVAEHFADKDKRLVFETMNEPRVTGTYYEWNVDTRNADCMAAVEVVNELNQASLDAIRAAGGENADRFVIVSVYAGSPNSAMIGAFHLPQDSAEDRLIVSLHAYTPYSFALDRFSDDSTFGKVEENEIKKLIRNVGYRYVRKGIPVIFDETGCLHKNNPDDRYAWCVAFISAAKEYGIPCLWWDNGYIGSEGEQFGLIDRRGLSIYEQSQSVLQGLMDAIADPE